MEGDESFQAYVAVRMRKRMREGVGVEITDIYRIRTAHATPQERLFICKFRDETAGLYVVTRDPRGDIEN